MNNETQLQEHSRKIEALQVRADYKDQRIEELNDKITNIDAKIDLINQNINMLMLKSNKEDNKLEKRLVAIETELTANKKALQDSRNRFTMIISIVTIFFTALTFIFNFLIK